MGDSGLPARRQAVYLLDQVIGEGRLVAELMQSGAVDGLAPQDRARALRLCMQTLRGLERTDRVLQKHLKKMPPLTVRNALRVGTTELCAGEAPHGVVNSFVEIVARHRKLGHLKGLTNAVLRKVAQTGPDAWHNLRVPRMPKWLRTPLVEAWGTEAVAAMEAVHFSTPPLDLTARDDPEEVARLSGGALLPGGSVRVADAGQVSAMRGFDEGLWWVQDFAASLPVKILKPQKGERILDLCAAPGGKTLQIAASGADVTAVDDSETRMARVKENLTRMRLEARLLVRDARSIDGEYDAVLLDAPCSATGTMRRHPDLPYAKDGSDFAALIDLQSELLEHAWRRVKPGGRLIYCTCSLLPDEGEVQIEAALERHKDMEIDRSAGHAPGVNPDWISGEGGVRLRPYDMSDLGGMDGFYVAALRKAA